MSLLLLRIKIRVAARIFFSYAGEYTPNAQSGSGATLSIL
jgi:hypothetical protein